MRSAILCHSSRPKTGMGGGVRGELSSWFIFCFRSMNGWGVGGLGPFTNNGLSSGVMGGSSKWVKKKKKAGLRHPWAWGVNVCDKKADAKKWGKKNLSKKR